MPVGRGSNSMMPQFINYSLVGLSRNILSVPWFTVVQLVVFFAPVFQWFDNLGISKCLNTLFLLSPHLCFIIGSICYLSSYPQWFRDELDLHTDRTNICFYHYGSWGWACRSLKANLSPHLALIIHYWPFQGGSFIVILFVNCYVAFHFLMLFF